MELSLSDRSNVLRFGQEHYADQKNLNSYSRV